MMALGPTGWIEDRDAVEASTAEMAREAGGSIIVGDQQELKGYARRQIAKGITGVFPWLAEITLFGALLAAWFQRRGTCVGQGNARAMQDSWLWSLAAHGEIGRVVEIAVEPIYAGSRVAIGGGRLSGDGSIGAWAAQYVSRFGVVPRGVYGQFDLSKPAENYAVEWGARGRGVPQIVVEAGRAIKVRCFRCMTADDIADAAFAGYAMAFCGNNTYGPKNADGVSRVNQRAAHCTEALGAALTPGGEILIGGQQSWGPNNPSGTRTLRYKGGTVEMRDGMCFVPVEDYARELPRGGEMWAFQFVRGHGFRPATAEGSA